MASGDHRRRSRPAASARRAVRAGVPAGQRHAHVRLRECCAHFHQQLSDRAQPRDHRCVRVLRAGTGSQRHRPRLDRSGEGERDRQVTQEVRLAATGTLLDWSIGGFYTDEQSDQFQTLNASTPDGAVFPVDLLTVNLPSSYQEYAGFGTLTWHLTQQLDFTGGCATRTTPSGSSRSAGPADLLGSRAQRDRQHRHLPGDGPLSCERETDVLCSLCDGLSAGRAERRAQ